MISTILQYSTIDYAFLKINLAQLSKFSDEIIIPLCNKLFNGDDEDEHLMDESIRIIQEFPKARILHFDWEGSHLGKRYYHNLSRKLGTELATNDWLLFVDADEILSDEFMDWFEANKQSDTGFWFTCYWYFRDPTYVANTLEGAGMLVRKKHCTWNVYSNEERQQIVHKTPGFHNGEGGYPVLSLTGKPMMHHYSWVRSKDNMIRKVKSWAHSTDKNWVALIEEEFSRPFNGRDFVHNYTFTTTNNVFNICI